MLNYVDRFKEYWKEGCSSIDYRLFMGNEKMVVFDRSKINEIVKKEIWTSRFGGNGGLRHGASVFIGELKQEDPSTGNQVEMRLANLSVNAGVSIPFFTLSGFAAILFFVLLIISSFIAAFAPLKLIIRFAFLISAVCTAVMLIKNAAVKNELKAQLDKERDEIIEILQRMEKDK